MATVTTNISTAFSDLDLNFTIHPVKKDINRYTNETAVINSIKNLILTNHYERPFQPEIGSNVRRMLFENMDTITSTVLENEISQTIKNYEPRANVSRINVSPDYDNNGFKVYMEFYVVNRTSPITINFFLERIR
jgi:phage baseplate assembly protein W